MGRMYSTYPAELPIMLLIKSGGNTFRHQLNEGYEVKCLFCGEKIILDKDSAIRYRHKYDTGAKIRCENCGRVADAAYYASIKNRKSLKAWDSKFVKTRMVENHVGM